MGLELSGVTLFSDERQDVVLGNATTLLRHRSQKLVTEFVLVLPGPPATSVKKTRLGASRYRFASWSSGSL